MDINYLLSGAISGLIGVFGTLLILKNMKKTLFQEVKQELLNFSELQKDKDFIEFVYNIGGLIGKGARTGIGMDRKLKPKDVIMELILKGITPKDGAGFQLPGQEPRTSDQRERRLPEPVME